MKLKRAAVISAGASRIVDDYAVEIMVRRCRLTL
jgi:hypothetical protein